MEENTFVPGYMPDLMIDCYGHVTPMFMDPENPQKWTKKRLCNKIGGNATFVELDSEHIMVYDLEGNDGTTPLNGCGTFILQLFHYPDWAVFGNVIVCHKEHCDFRK